MSNKIKKFTIQSGKKIESAMKIINRNGKGICFVVNKNNKLLGVVTDGDIRRALIKNKNINLSIDNIMNRSFRFANITDSDSDIRSKFDANIRVLPLCNKSGTLIDLADGIKNHSIPIMEPSLTGNESKYVNNCLASNWISSQGIYVKKFEEIFSKIFSGNAISVSNGTVALHLSLLALGIKKGDEVIVPDITFAATINAVLYCNAKPVICEVNKKTWCIDPLEIRKLISPKTKAIIPVHLYGQVCDLKKIYAIAKKYNLKVIEDCAESLGSKYNNIYVGSKTDAATFSFYGNKTISTGEGGMIVFKDKKVAKYAEILRDHGMSKSKKYWHNIIGYNFRLTNIQASIGVAQMERLTKIIKKKIYISKLYDRAFKNNKFIKMIPYKNTNLVHSNWLYTIILDKKIDRNIILEKLLECGIDTRPVFYPLHLMPPYKKFKTSKSLKNSEFISSSGLSLPSSINLNKKDISYISKNLNEILAKSL